MKVNNAEIAFIQAFERLKSGSPVKCSIGTPVSQANVAREAGVTPSALRKSRFPQVVSMIQQWIDANELPDRPAAGSTILQRQKARSLRRRIEDLTKQRDMMAKLLLEADAQVLHLTLECERLRALAPKSNVTAFPQVPRATKDA
ncbi:hypothetical protein VPH13_07785 [Stenotrophomonas pavanii]|uniref:hypothetical protein n=1 Tax=Stenotrophomonas pavanii TaxID=487698 RepID=UPI002DBCFF0D|nr:hypothetical protein [Stenotrophomonas pavanii]MEC4338616.1 hypothetical protein [Stenotrophomonas pavanii]